jgi:glutathione S-transferase
MYDIALRAEAAKNTEAVPHPTLVVVDEEVSGGGNAMAIALSLLSKSGVKISLKDQLMQVDWCEWERTVLRKAAAAANEKKLAAAFDHLEKSLSAGSGIHAVGYSITVADIVLCSTLNSLSTTSTFPTATNHYIQTYSASWAKVETALQELVEQA